MAYEDTISVLEQDPQPGVAAKGAGPYSEIIGAMGDANRDAAHAATFVGSQSNPDKAARSQELSRKLGVPAQAIEADLPAFEAQAKSFENSAVIKSSPMLASWLASNPEAARVAHDDFQNLGFLEKAIAAAKAGFSQGQTSDALAREGARQLESDEIKETDTERALKGQLSKPDGVDGGFYNVLKTTASFLGGLESQAENAAWIALGGGALGSAVPGIGTMVGTGAGFVAGMAKEGYVTGAGQIYNELKGLRDEDGNPLSPEIIRGAAHAGGLALGALNALNIQMLNKPFAKAAESLIPQLAKKAVERPTVTAALAGFGKQMAAGGVIGAEFGLMSQMIMQGAVDLAKTYDSPDKWATVFNSEAERDKALDKIVDSMESTALAFGVMHAAPASLSMAVDVARARKAVQDQSFMRSLADGSAASKVRERSPSTFQSYVAALTDGSPVENVYIPAEVVLKLYQDAGIDPKDRAADHLFPFVKDMGEQLEQALPVKGDVVVKTSDYATHLAGTDVDTTLKNDLRVTPDSMTLNEAKQFFQDVKKELGERAKDLKADIGKADEPGDKIRTQVAKQLEEAGYKTRTAGGMAAQMAAFFSTIGKRLGIDPVGLFEKYGLKVGRPEGQEIPKGAMEKLDQPVYHGSPHTFDEFKLQHIGKGEGAQAYGWGLYFAGNKEVAKWYRDKLARGSGFELKDTWFEKFNSLKSPRAQEYFQAFQDMVERDGDIQAAAEAQLAYVEDHNKNPEMAGDKLSANEIKTLRSVFKNIDKYASYKEVKGRLYHVEIPEHENFLDLDKPLSEQPGPVKAALEKAGIDVKFGEGHRAVVRDSMELQIENVLKEKWLVDWARNDLKKALSEMKEADFRNARTIFESAVHQTLGAEIMRKHAPELWASMNAVSREATEIRNEMVDGSELYKSLSQSADENPKSPVWKFWEKHIDDPKNMVSPEEATSRYLHSIGIPGLTYLEGASRSKGKGNYNYVLFDDSLAKITGFEQESRGYITFGADRKVSIALLEKADLSTFLHESGHFYLEVLRDLTERSKDSPLAEDVQTIFKHLGIKNWKELKTEHHEKFARSFEAYLMEGKAPSRELRGAFQRFRNWLTTIYEKIANLGVELTPEVRNVFDRMLASDDEILAARRAQKLEALFTDAKAAGMSDAEFAAYKKAVARVTEDADERLLNKVMGDVRRQRTAAWKEEEKTVRAEELTKVDARPDIRALHFLRTGEALDGRKDLPPMALDRSALESAYGSDILADMPRGRPGHPVVVSEGGVHPDQLGQLFGYPSGDAMVKDLVALERKARRARTVDPKDTRSVRNMLADEATARRMKREHGDMLDDGSIKEEAMAAVHSERQAEILATELRALSRTAKDAKPMPFTVARDWARGVMNGKTVGEASKFFRYAREEAKAARLAEKAMLAGDHVEAFKQKQLQLLNHVLFMEARRASNEVEVAQRRLDGYASAKVLRSVDPDYLDQVHQLLERFDFATASDKEVEKRESLARWIDRQEADGGEVKISDKLRSEAFRKHYTKLTLDEFRGLVDAADNIIHIGKLKNTLTDLAQKRDLFEVVGEAVAQVANLRVKLPPEQRNPGVGGKGLDRISAKWLRVKQQVLSMDAALLKMEQVFDWLDLGDSNGVFNRIVFKRIADAGIVEHDLRNQLANKLRELNARMPKEFRKDFNTRYQVDELIDSRTGKPSQLLKSEILAIALNVGNASNFDKLLRGEKWSESAVRQVLDRHMSKADWQFVQGIWDTVAELWPKIEELEKRLSGVAPEKVEIREFETAHGTVKGGYYPVMYDPLRSYDVELNRQRNADQLFERNYIRATTPHGHTIERTQPYARPLFLSMDVLPRHLQAVTHDLAYREAIMDADKFLSNPKIRKAVEETLGREVYTQFRPWLQAIANDKVFDQRGLAWWDKAAHWARTSATMVGLGFRFSTMFIHGLTAASNSLGELGPKWMMSGMKGFFGSPQKMAAARDFVFERSGEMRHRMNEVDRDVRDGLSDLEGKHGPVYAARRFAYYGISALDMASALPTWMGAYNKAMHGGMSEEQAVYAADKSVRVAHGGGHIKDLPAIQRGSEWQKLFTMFYSFWSHFYNRQRHMGRQLVEGGQKAIEGDVQGAAKDFSMVMARSVFYFIIPQIIHATIRAKSKADEDKSFLELAAEEIGLGFFAGIPVLRDVAHAAFMGKDYEATPAAQIVKSLAASAKDFGAITGMSDHELSDRWVRHAMETSGYVFGLPLGQPAGSVQFLWDVMHGDQDPEGVADWLHGIMYGKLENKE